jgi:CTP-dependent riboflavin kinase
MADRDEVNLAHEALSDRLSSSVKAIREWAAPLDMARSLQKAQQDTGESLHILEGGNKLITSMYDLIFLNILLCVVA